MGNLELAEDLESTEGIRLEQAQGLVRAYCGWHIAPERTDTVRLGVHDGVAVLPSLWVTEVVSVTGVSVYAEDALLAEDDYTLQGSVLTLRRYDDWGWCDTARYYRTVDVEFTHGYTEPPPDVTAVVQSLAQQAIRQPVGLRSKTVGPFSESYAVDTSFAVGDYSVLDRYKLPARP